MPDRSSCRRIFLGMTRKGKDLCGGHAKGDVPLRQCSAFERPDFGNSRAVLLGEVERIEHGGSHFVVEPRRALFLQRGKAFPQFGPVKGKDLKRGRVVE